jgi:hypothetical protein
MKYTIPTNVKYIAIAVVVGLVILWAYNHFKIDGFQNAPSTTIQEQMAATAPTNLCTTLQSTQKLIQMQLDNTTNEEVAAGLKSQLLVITTQMNSACNPQAPPATAS